MSSSAAPWPGCEPFHSRPDGTVGDPPTGQPKIPADSRQPGPREFPAAYSLAIPRIAAPADGHRGPCAAMKTVRRPPYPKWNPGYFPCSSLTPLPLSSRRPSVSFGGFGFRKPLLYPLNYRGTMGGTPTASVVRSDHFSVCGPDPPSSTSHSATCWPLTSRPATPYTRPILAEHRGCFRWAFDC